MTLTDTLIAPLPVLEILLRNEEKPDGTELSSIDAGDGINGDAIDLGILPAVEDDGTSPVVDDEFVGKPSFCICRLALFRCVERSLSTSLVFCFLLLDGSKISSLPVVDLNRLYCWRIPSASRKL